MLISATVAAPQARIYDTQFVSQTASSLRSRLGRRAAGIQRPNPVREHRKRLGSRIFGWSATGTAEKYSIEVDEYRPSLYKQHPSAALTVETDEGNGLVGIGL
jgi:hypothetical protein